MDFQNNPVTSSRLHQLFMNLFSSQRQLRHAPGAFFIKLTEKSFKFQFGEFLACDKCLNPRKYIYMYVLVLHFVNLPVVL